MAGARHHVDGGDTAGSGFLNRGIARIERVEDARFRLDRAGAIAAAAGANVAMGIDESRHEHFTGDIVDFGARGNRNFVGRADGDNLAARDDEHAVGDGRPAHRNNLGADKDLRFLLGVNSSG